MLFVLSAYFILFVVKWVVCLLIKLTELTNHENNVVVTVADAPQGRKVVSGTILTQPTKRWRVPKNTLCIRNIEYISLLRKIMFRQQFRMRLKIEERIFWKKPNQDFLGDSHHSFKSSQHITYYKPSINRSWRERMKMKVNMLCLFSYTSYSSSSSDSH